MVSGQGGRVVSRAQYSEEVRQKKAALHERVLTALLSILFVLVFIASLSLHRTKTTTRAGHKFHIVPSFGGTFFAK